MKKQKPRNILKHRAIENLQLLNEKELKSFSKWLNSSWSNSIAKLAELFDILKSRHPDFTHPKLTKRYLYNRLYPGKTYHDKAYLNLMSELSLAVEDFLIHSHIENNKSLKEKIRLTVINERRATDSRKEKMLDHHLKTLNKKEVKHTSDYLQLVNLYGLHFRLNHPNKSPADKKDDLIAIDKNLDYFYAISKARNLMEIGEREYLLSEKIENSISKELIFRLGKDIPAVQFYKGYFKEGFETPKERFLYLKRIFLNHIDDISKVDQRIIYLILINLSARIKRSGNDEILEEALLLNKLAFQKDFILDNHQITSHSFANITTTACSRQDFDFAQTFLGQYIQYLPFSIQRDAIDWGTLIISYKQGTKNVVELANKLNDHTRAHTVFSLRIRVLITQVLFDAYHRDENDMDEKFINYIDAFEKKLERESKYPEKQLIGLRAFNKHAKKLASFFRNKNYEMEELITVSLQISQEPIIHAKSWLIEKVEQIKRSVSN